MTPETVRRLRIILRNAASLIPIYNLAPINVGMVMAKATIIKVVIIDLVTIPFNFGFV